MHSEWTDPDARSSLIPLCCGLAIGLATGVAVGLLVGVKLALGVGG